jgi:pyruvate formate lyase activating enzyme
MADRNHPGRDREAEAVITEVQRWSGNDGPGIRTLIFFKGCPLRCAWCCNPECWSPRPQLAFFEDRCRDCGLCREVCPQSTATSDGGERFGRPSGCTACGQCVTACPSGARELMGRNMSLEEALSVIERDRVFYRQSGGGVTFSGGEALAQPEFLGNLVERCWAGGISMVLETCGHFSWPKSKELLARMDLIFLDIKHMNPLIHRQVTGVDNETIQQNAIRIAQEGLPLVIRVPLIPTINDDVDNIKATAAFVAENLDGVLGVEVLPYHTLGKGKYRALGLEYPLDHLVPPTAADMARARGIFQDFGIDVLYLGSTP